MIQEILDYWYALEFFNPCWPVKPQQDTNLLYDSLPWSIPQNDQKIRVSYDVYFGKAMSNDLIVWLLHELGLSPEDASVEKDHSITCVCALKIDETGRYVADSFSLSSFVWAIGSLSHAGEIGAKLDMAELEKIQTAINSKIVSFQEEEGSFLSRENLGRIFEFTCRSIRIDQSLIQSSLWSRRKEEYANKKGEFPPLDPSTELMQSFYLKDLAKIKASPTDKVKDYAQAMVAERQNRIHIDVDVEQMKNCLSGESFPLGAWPSRYSPSLMQQIAINLAISNQQEIFSVNGPPGTGKTTLLKEIVASNVVQRAIVMEQYEKPDQAFQQKSFQNPPDQYNKNFYTPDSRLSAYGILVASNNNAAVENISIELPKAIEKERTGRFSGAADEDAETYFADVATELLDKPAWGLISARLGKKSNLKALKERLWWAKDGITLKRYYDEKLPDWNTARKNFRTALEAVKRAQADIVNAQKLLLEQKRAVEAFEAAQSRDEKAQELYLKQEKVLLEKEEECSRLEQEIAVQQQNVTTLHHHLSWFKRTFFRFFRNNNLVKEWIATKEKVEELVIQMTQQRTACSVQAEVVRQAKAQWKALEQERIKAQTRLSEIHAAIAPYQACFGGNWADDQFWQNISANEQSQAACPWTYHEYDKLREELFYQALMLHKAFVLSSKCVEQNLKRLFTLWDGKFTDGDGNSSYGDLLNTLMLVIPVVSTTFASVQTFLAGVQENQLGLLVVDEAGQATPQSALGALWRARKCMIVGDPLQVEPIVTIPKELQKRFADEYDIPASYRVQELSVQMLADQLNRYGGTLKLNGEELWLGSPLVIHRRCIEPMFSISNEVAYNGKMFCKTAPPESSQRFLFQSSVWFDCVGAEKGEKDHSVPEQIQLAAKLLGEGIRSCGGLPEIFVITPFTSVERALKEAFRPVIRQNLPEMSMQSMNDWLQENCGTIHTFQGKEAAEVLLVLGCDTQTGKGAAQWVGQKPNIINVAVSRAKFRLAVIGDYSQWKNIPYVQTVCKYLARENSK